MRVRAFLPVLVVLAALVAGTTSRPLAQGPAVAQFASDPVLVGAGDIADCTTATDSATAALLDAIEGTVFTAGDNAYPLGRPGDFADCYGPTWGRHKARTRPAPGNHDYYSLGAAPYFAYFGTHAGPAGRGYYSYDLGAWHIVALDSNLPAFAGSPQEQWLRADLAANPTQCTLAYWHHPLFSSGQHGDQPYMRDLYRALYEAGADVVVNGHDHNYEQFHRQDPDGALVPNGIREFVVGTGGTSLRAFGVIHPNSAVRNSDTHGVLKLTLRPTSYDWEFVPIAGGTFTDVGSRPCVGGAPAPVGGRGFALGGTAAGAEMVWTTGTAQTGYAVVRFAGGTTTFLPGPSSFLPAATTEYIDAGAASGAASCYLLVPLNGGGVAGLSDLLCVVRNTASASGAPGNAMVQLNQSNMATLTWSPPAGQTGYVLWTIPLDGSPQGANSLPATANRAMHDTGGAGMCYVVVATTDGTATGNSDVVCAIPGQSSLTAAAAVERVISR